MNTAQILTLIIQGINLAGTLVIEAQQFQATLDFLRNLDPDVTVNVRTLSGKTFAVNQDTRDKVAAWLAANL